MVVLVNGSVTFSECLWGFSMPVSCVVKSRKRVSQAAHTTRYTNHFFITFLCIKKSSEGPNSSTMTQQSKREVFPSASVIRQQCYHGHFLTFIYRWQSVCFQRYCRVRKQPHIVTYTEEGLHHNVSLIAKSEMCTEVRVRVVVGRFNWYCHGEKQRRPSIWTLLLCQPQRVTWGRTNAAISQQTLKPF